MPGLYTHTTRATGYILTANAYNADHQNHIDNLIPTKIDDESASLSAMQAVEDPYPAGTASQAASLAEELRRIRYVLSQITGETYWYIDPDTSIASLYLGT